MPDQDVDIFLEHFGIMGMKWGIRNSNKESGKERRASNREFNKRHALVRTPLQKKNYRTRNRASAVVGVAVFLASRGKMMNTPTSAILAGGAALATQSFIKDRQDKRMSDLKKN